MNYIEIEDNGNNNKIIGNEFNHNIENFRIIFNGDNNTIYLDNSSKFKNFVIEVNGSDNVTKIGKRCNLKGRLNFKENNNLIQIGKFTTTVNVKFEVEHGTKIIVGNDCMFSSDIIVRSGDSHSIVDLKTKKRINLPQDVILGNHIWVGLNVLIGKGTNIKGNSVVGSGSFVNKNFTKGNCIIGGVPAKIVKENILWDRKNLKEEFPMSHFDNLFRENFYNEFVEE